MRAIRNELIILFSYIKYILKNWEKKKLLHIYSPFHNSLPLFSVHAHCGITARNYETGYISNPFLICCQPLQTEFETFLNLIIFEQVN